MTAVEAAERPRSSNAAAPGRGGWAGTVLFVDLSTGSLSTRSTFDYQVEKYLGGVGLCTRIYWDMGCPHPSAFHPDAPLYFAVGPLTGLPGPFHRAELCGIAPQSYPEELFIYSGVGGKFPAQLKYAGHDAIVVIGAAEAPVYLEIRDSEVAIRDATALWGTDTIEAQQRLVAGSKDRAVLAIGPAGENLSRVAVVAAETGSAAGQGGFGAVMGAKKLKAIVVEGTGTFALADAQGGQGERKGKPNSAGRRCVTRRDGISAGCLPAVARGRESRTRRQVLRTAARANEETCVMLKIVARDARPEELAQAVQCVIAKQGMSAVTIRYVVDEASGSHGILAQRSPEEESVVSFASGLAVERFHQAVAASAHGLHRADARRAMLEASLPICQGRCITGLSMSGDASSPVHRAAANSSSWPLPAHLCRSPVCCCSTSRQKAFSRIS